ncbi:hypothetical protein JXL83_03935 [candidate division WOR-3 bacterium]|nr:hypothetical protein [candidate division WOR-3 bacterium]
MVSVCPQCGGKVTQRISPQVVLCPYCGSSVEVEALSSEVWTLNPVIEKKAAWNLASSCIGEISFIKGYLVPFSSPPISVPLNEKAPRGLKLSFGDRIFKDRLDGFETLSSKNKPYAYIPFWQAKKDGACVWISASDGSRTVIKDEKKPSKTFLLETVALALSIAAGTVWKLSFALSVLAFSAIFTLSLFIRPGKK